MILSLTATHQKKYLKGHKCYWLQKMTFQYLLVQTNMTEPRQLVSRLVSRCCVIPSENDIHLFIVQFLLWLYQHPCKVCSWIHPSWYVQPRDSGYPLLPGCDTDSWKIHLFQLYMQKQASAKPGHAGDTDKTHNPFKKFLIPLVQLPFFHYWTRGDLWNSSSSTFCSSRAT